MSPPPKHNSPSGEPPTPFHDAARAGDVAGLRRMLDAGADPNEEDWTGAPPLYWAVGGSVDAARVLLEAGADPDDRDGFTRPFVRAAEKNRLDLLKLLLEFGADPHLTDPGDGENALVSAAWHGNLEMVDFLLGLGVSPHVVARKGVTALGCATERGHDQVAASLKAAGARELAPEDDSAT